MEISRIRQSMMHHRMDGREDQAHSEDECREPGTQTESGIEPGVTRLPGIATQLIGQRMRTMYASMVREPVPDDLLNLVRELESKEDRE